MKFLILAIFIIYNVKFLFCFGDSGAYVMTKGRRNATSFYEGLEVVKHKTLSKRSDDMLRSISKNVKKRRKKCGCHKLKVL